MVAAQLLHVLFACFVTRFVDLMLTCIGGQGFFQVTMLLSGGSYNFYTGLLCCLQER